MDIKRIPAQAERSLKTFPRLMTLIVLLLLGLPAVGIIWGLNFDFLTMNLEYHTVTQKEHFELLLKGYFTQSLFQWSGFSLAVITAILILTEYRYLHNDISLIIALSIIFTGSIDAAHIFLVDGFTDNLVYKKQLDEMVWSVSNSISALMLIAGLFYILKAKHRKPSHITTIFLFMLVLVIGAFLTIYYISTYFIIHTIWSNQIILSRPFELIPLILFLLVAAYLYPKLYSKQKDIMLNCIFLMCLTQCVIAMYLMLLSYASYDIASNVSYCLKIVFYFIPFAYLMNNYSNYFKRVLNVKNILLKQKRELQYLASHDVLTKIMNRRAFEECLVEALENARRYNNKFALLIIDIDNFKQVNDTLGHGCGDSLLKAFVKRIQKSSRIGDKSARLGGDEFALLTPSIHDTSGVRILAERLLKDFAKPYEFDNQRLISTASIGIAVYPDDASDGPTLMRNADLALCSSKKSGRNTYEFYNESINALHHQESMIEACLRDVLDKDELSVYYQPVYNLITKEVVGMEALLRWDNPILGRVSPEKFIAVAERTGLIINIGDWVLNRSCKQAAQWHKEYNKNLTMAVNLSPIQLTNRHFTDKLSNLLNKHNLSPNLLCLEITESLLMENNLECHNVLSAINSLGVFISIDDFGKGYSSLNRLKNLPISTLKIDRDFISDITDLNEKVTLTDIIIELANQLKINVIAEGIETKVQLDYLVERHCYHGQGFYLSKPLTAEDFERLVLKKAEVH